jgi:isoleucyl-tRNA synthetase
MKETKKSAVALAEEQMLEVWAKERTFQKSLEIRRGRPYFSFYDGPPFANGLPHYGHVVPSTIKDAVARYKTMRGFYVPRVAGWDTHGLPVEYEVEKQLALSGKRQILELGVDKFNDACRASVFRYRKELEDFIGRLGRWVDLENAYATLNDEYIESVWWVFAEIYKKGLVYRGFRSMPYCPRCATPLSNFELNQGYQDNIEDPSVFALFPLKADPKTKLLAWTTTPWTLPANAALAVKADADYAYVKLASDASMLILAKERLDVLDLRKQDYSVLKTVKGQELQGLRYLPPYQLPDNHSFTKEQLTNAWKVFATDYVKVEEGTGVVHTGTPYGEVDLELILKENLPLIESVDRFGKITDVIPGLKGVFFKEADDHIIAELSRKERVFAAERFRHTYPFCWRCDTPLMYFATPNWLVKVTDLIDELLKNNQQINWVPKHIKDGRFGNWLADARDWGVSRNRFWGSPLPVWQCADDHFTVVGSLTELKQKAIKVPEKLDLHRPGIDEVKLKCDNCGKRAKRVEEVFDCWFESGAMPYASIHYPFDSRNEFKQAFPAEFISEGLDQTRGWFYTLHVLATALFNQPAYKNVISHGIVVAADGKKLSKRLRNYPPLEQVFDNYGADVLRFFILNSPVVAGEEVRFSADHLRDTQRNIFMTLQNSFSFFKTYSKLDNWQAKALKEPNSNHLLDQWILARLNQTIAEVTDGAEKYQLHKATRPLVELVDDLSNWYIRRSRRRFWKSQNDGDKQMAYATLHYVLARICQMLAPWSPFVSDRLWREIMMGAGEAESVHLSDWPSVNKQDSTSIKLLKEMRQVRQLIADGLAQRAEAKVKVRQPLTHCILTSDIESPGRFSDIVAEELNVKTVDWSRGTSAVKLATEVTPELKAEGVARNIVRLIQSTRKKAGFNVEDRIQLRISSPSGEIIDAINRFKDMISAETLTTGELSETKQPEHSESVKLDGQDITIAVKRV